MQKIMPKVIDNVPKVGYTEVRTRDGRSETDERDSEGSAVQTEADRAAPDQRSDKGACAPAVCRRSDDVQGDRRGL